MKASQLGWVLTAAIVGIGFGSGFQAKPAMKIGYIDMPALYQDSNLKLKNDERLQKLAAARAEIINFLQLFPSFTQAQLDRFKVLATKKEPLTPSEAEELKKLKADAQASTKQYDDLRQKPNPSAQDVTLLNDLGSRNDLNAQARARWGREFQDELAAGQSNANNSAVQAIKDALAQVAKPQGYSLIFRENVAVYGSSALGDAVKKIVDKNADKNSK